MIFSRLLFQELFDGLRVALEDLGAHVNGLDDFLHRARDDRGVGRIEERLDFFRDLVVGEVRQTVLDARRKSQQTRWVTVDSSPRRNRRGSCSSRRSVRRASSSSLAGTSRLSRDHRGSTCSRQGQRWNLAYERYPIARRDRRARASARRERSDAAYAFEDELERALDDLRLDCLTHGAKESHLLFGHVRGGVQLNERIRVAEQRRMWCPTLRSSSWVPSSP